MGVRPLECRQTVIRLAAPRSSRTLAKQQLTAPSEQGSLQLSRVLTSAYRLLDPRQRADPLQRALVGRILPHALSVAGQTHFVSSVPSVRQDSSMHSTSDGEVGYLDDLSGHSEPPTQWTISLGDQDLIRRRSRVRRIARDSYRRIFRPASYVVSALVVAGVMVGMLAGFSSIGNDQAVAQRQDQNPPSTAGSQSTVVSEMTTTTVDQPLSASLRGNSAPASRESEPDRQQAQGERTQPESEAASLELAGIEQSSSGLPVLVPSEPEKAVPERTVPAQPAVSPAKPSRSSLAPAADALAAEPITPPAISAVNASTPAPSPASIVGLDRPEPVIPEPPRKSAIQQPRLLDRHAVPSDDQVKAARRGLGAGIPSLSESIDIPSLGQRIDLITHYADQQEPGSVQHWTAMVVLAEHQWLVDEIGNVVRRIDDLNMHYQINTARVLASTFIQSCRLARLPKTHEHLFANGLRLCDWLLVANSPAECQQVVEILMQIDRQPEPTNANRRLQDFSAAIEQMVRLANATDRWTHQADPLASNKATATNTTATKDTGIAGRYHCLMLRDWDRGLVWLCEISDSRISRVAQQEMEVNDIDDQFNVATRWLEIAKRYDGRSANSMRLHGIDLLQAMLEESTAIKQLQIERKIEETMQALPMDLRPIAIEADPVRAQVDRNRLTIDALEPGLTGRITIEGEDVGVRINYQLGAVITHSVLETLGQQIDRPGETFSWQVQGTLQLADETKVSVSVQPLAEGARQEVRLNGQLISIDPLDQGAELTLPAGTPTISWTVVADRLDRAYLRLHDAGTGRPLVVVYEPVNDGQPTGLTIKVHSNDQ